MPFALRSRDMQPAMIFAASRMSWISVWSLTDIRMERAASSSESPMAARTWLGVRLTLLQAEPAETQTPFMSSMYKSDSAVTPSMQRFRIFLPMPFTLTPSLI